MTRLIFSVKLLSSIIALILFQNIGFSQVGGDIEFEVTTGKWYQYNEGAANWFEISEPNTPIGKLEIMGNSAINYNILNAGLSCETLVINHTGGSLVTFGGAITCNQFTANTGNFDFDGGLSIDSFSNISTIGSSLSNITFSSLNHSGYLLNIGSNVTLDGANQSRSVNFVKFTGGKFIKGNNHLINVELDISAIDNSTDVANLKTGFNGAFNNLIISDVLDFDNITITDNLTFGGDLTIDVTSAFGFDLIFEGIIAVVGDCSITVNSSGAPQTVYVAMTGSVTIGGHFQTAGIESVHMGVLHDFSQISIGGVAPAVVIFESIDPDFSVTSMTVNLNGIGTVLHLTSALETSHLDNVTISNNFHFSTDNNHKIDIYGLNIPNVTNVTLPVFYDVDLINGNIIHDDISVSHQFKSNGNVYLNTLTMTDANSTVNVQTGTLNLGNEPTSLTSTLSNTTISSGAVFQVDENSKITFVNPSSNTLQNNGEIRLLSSSNGNALMLTPVSVSGSGNTTQQFYLSGGLSSGKSDDGNYWREIGFPISSTIANVTWGSSFNSKIQGILDNANNPLSTTDNPLESYISYYDPSSFVWKIPETTLDVQVYGPFQIWQHSNETVTITGPSSTSNDMDYNLFAQDANAETPDWNHLFNPTNANFDLANALDNEFSGKAAGNLAWVHTEYAVDQFAYRSVGSGGNYGSSFIPPGQAFWINSLSLEFGTYDQARKSISNAGVLKKTGELGSNALRIELCEGEIKHDYLFFRFNDVEDGNFDASNLNTTADNSPNGYVLRNTSKLIHKEYLLSDLSYGFVEQYYVIGTEQRSLSLRISDNSIDSSYKIFVRDRKENKTHNLSQSEYNFTHYPSFNQTASSRFEIFITNESLVEESEILENVRIINKFDYLELTLKSNTDIIYYDIFSANGAKISSDVLTKQIDIRNLSSGVYILSLIDRTGLRKNLKFIK